MSKRASPVPRTKAVSREQQPEPPVTLTQRQVQCLELVSKGFTAGGIGELLGMHIRSVERHLTHCRESLDAATTTEACCIAIRKGLIA